MSRKPKTYTYKMRAECLHDVALACQTVPMTAFGITRPDLAPDVDIAFNSPWPLAKIIAGLRTIVDGHVMAETVALAADYTGER